ncbi:hypothetical protein SAMN06265370_1261, partial [Puniceibacterium sediminis]
MSKPPPARYRTTNWSSYNAALRRRGSMLILVDQDMAWLAPHEGRPAVHPSSPMPPSSSAFRLRFFLSSRCDRRKRQSITHGTVVLLLAEVPWHESVDVSLHVLIEDLSECGGDIGFGVYGVQATCAYQRGDTRPCRGA